jgi:diamine N-acetyltransferase
VILREAVPSDVPAMAKLASDAFIAKFAHLYSAENLSAFLAETYSQNAIAAELASPDRVYRLAAAEDGELLGYCKIGLKCGFPQHASGQRAMELKQLYTAAGATGQGIGAALMDWAMEQFRHRGADEVQLSVYAENHGAHRFYARYGFEKVADITFRVGDHIDPEFLFARML